MEKLLENVKKCPKMPFGASSQPPRKMLQKCLENVLVLGLALERCPEIVKNYSWHVSFYYRCSRLGRTEAQKKDFPLKCPKNVQKTFLAILGLPPKNDKKMSQSAFWGFLAASQKNVQKMSGKCPGAGVGAGKMCRNCQKNVPKMSPDIFQTFFLTFFGQ